MDPASPAATKMLSLLRYVDGDLATTPPTRPCRTRSARGQQVLFYLEVPPVLFGRIAEGIAARGPRRGTG